MSCYNRKCSNDQGCCCPKCITKRLDCHKCCKCIPQILDLVFVPDDVAEESSSGLLVHSVNGVYTGTAFGASIWLDENTCNWRIVSEPLDVDATQNATGDYGVGCTAPIFGEIVAELSGVPGILTIRPAGRVLLPYQLTVEKCVERVCDNCVCLPECLCVGISYWPDGVGALAENDEFQFWVPACWDDDRCGWVALFPEHKNGESVCLPETELFFYPGRISEANHNCDIFMDAPDYGYNNAIRTGGTFDCDGIVARWGYTGLVVTPTAGETPEIAVEATSITSLPANCGRCCFDKPDVLNVSVRYLYGDDYFASGDPCAGAGEGRLSDSDWHDFTIARDGCYIVDNTRRNEYGHWSGEIELGCYVEPTTRLLLAQLTFHCSGHPHPTAPLCDCTCVPADHDPGVTACHGLEVASIEDVDSSPSTCCICGTAFSYTNRLAFCGQMYFPSPINGFVDEATNEYDPIYAEFFIFEGTCHAFQIIVYE